MKRCIFLCHLIEAAHRRKISLDEMLLQAAEWGLQGAEADYDALQAAPQPVLEALERAGIPLLALYGKCDLAHGGDLERARAMLSFAAAHQIRQVLIVPGYPKPGENREQITQELIRRLQVLCGIGAAAQIHLSIENFGYADRPYHTIGEIERLLAAVPDLCYTLDTGNFLFGRENALRAASLFAPRIHHVHCKDFSLRPIPGSQTERDDHGAPLYPAALGAGAAPLAAVIARLREYGYQGALSIEQFGVADPFSAVRESLSFLKKH